MSSRQNGDFRRSVISALAAFVAAAVPSLVSSNALAQKADKADGASTDAQAAAKPKPAAKTAAKKSHAVKGQKPQHAKADAAKAEPKAQDAQAKAEPKAAPASSKSKKTKKTASRSAGAKPKKSAKKADSDAPGRSCPGTPISIDRGGLEAQSLALVDCHDKPLDHADEALSVLARPWGAPRPASLHALAAGKGKPGKLAKLGKPVAGPDGEVAPGVRLLDKGLLTRVSAVAHHFPGRPISLVSGYRPQSRGSLHQSARALDLRVAGVSNEELVAFCKTLKDTGCGYYPNSSFVHLDVRNPGTGPVSWIDSSGPGETPHYVKQWPLPAEESEFAVLPPDTEPHDATADPWALDPDDEHAAHPDSKDVPHPAALPAHPTDL
jgi:hypothetical protein